MNESLTITSNGDNQTRLVADVLPLDRWTVSPEYLRDMYGQEVADEYVRIRDEEMRLSDDELRAKIARDLAMLVFGESSTGRENRP